MTVAAPLIYSIVVIHYSFSSILSVHIIQTSSELRTIFKQNPSLKLPKSSRPPEYPFLPFVIGLMAAIDIDSAVLIKSLRLDDKANIPY